MSGIRRAQGWKWLLCVCVGLWLGAQASYGGSIDSRHAVARQEHYRWRNDDGGESAATWKAAADTQVNGVQVGQNLRLRVVLSSVWDKPSLPHGGITINPTYGPVVLEYSTARSWAGTWISVTATNVLAAFRLAGTTYYNHGDPTTAQLPGTGQWVGSGKCVESPNEGFELSMNAEPQEYCNIEYCLVPTAKANAGQTYYFRARIATVSPSMEYDYDNNWQFAVLTVGASSEPPAIISLLTANGQVGVAFSYRTLATGTEPITYSASGLPGGLNIDGTTGLITGYPTADGTFDVSLTANSAYGSTTKTLRITVADAVPPTITSALTASGQVGVDFLYTVTASGTAPITYGASGLPGGLTLNTASGAITGRPTQAGSFNVGLSASNAGGQNNKTLAVTIIAAETEIIVDNTDTNHVAASTIWIQDRKSVSPNPWGVDSLFLVPTSESNDTWFRWIPDLPVAATYDVYAWWTCHTNRSTNATYTVTHAAGKTVLYVNQRDPANAGKWNRLGAFSFGAGTNGLVEVNAENGQVCADAVRLVRQ